MDHVEIWDKAKALLREELANVSYTTWIDQPLKPVYVVDDKLALEVISEFTEKTIRARYLSMITEAVSQVAGREMSVELMSVKERIAWQESQKKEEQAPLQGVNTFNPKSTFDTFVVGSSNRFAHAASLAVAEAPGMAYNPLFLYGGVGLGKTHLMHAIGHYILDNNPSAKVMYITSENFTNQLISAIAKKTNQEFRDKLRNVDVLMVDDIQFIAGKTATQEEFFHTFNELHSGGKQIVISSDRPPKEIPTLEERLRSRFEWGLIADIGRPDYETRIAILRKKAELEHILVDDDVLHFIAEQTESNIRELEGSLTRVNAMAALNGGKITLDVAREALENIMPGREKKVLTPEIIMDACAKEFGLTRDDLLSQRRNREIAGTRQLAMYLIREMTQLSTTRIGEVFGGRDHTTVMHACDKVARLEKSDEDTQQALTRLRRTLGNR